MLIEFLDFWVPLFQDYGNWIYVLVFFAAFFELLLGVGFIFPGGVIVFLISFFAAQNQLRPEMILFMAFAGVMAGSMSNYFIGKRYIQKLGWNNSELGKTSFFKQVTKIVQRNLFQAFVLGRFTPGVKELAPLIAGGGMIKFSRFLIYSSIGNLLWLSIFVGIPYIFSYSLILSENIIDKLSYFIVVIFVIFSLSSAFQFIVLKYGKISLKLFFKTLGSIRSVFLSDESIRKIIKKYPKTVSLIAHRFQNEGFFGMKFTILLSLFVYIFILFIGFIRSVLESSSNQALDNNLATFFYAIQNKLGVEIFLWITSLSRGLVIVFFFILLSLLLFIFKKKNEIFALGISLIFLSTLVYIMKFLFHSERPMYPVYLEQSFSFPSGHASISLLFYGYIFWFLIVSSTYWKRQVWYFFIAILIIAGVGLSRLYLGVHFLSDIVGGYMLGSLGLIFCIGLTFYLNRNKENKNIRENLKNNYFIMWIFLILAGIFFITYNTYKPYQKVFISLGNGNENIEKLEYIFPETSTRYTQTFFGEDAENIHFIFLARDENILQEVFETSGWSPSDLYNYESFKKTISNVLFQTPYDTAPMTPLFWNNTTQQFGYQILPDPTDLRFRHHIRIWRTGATYKNKKVFVGVGVYDIGLKWNIVHAIDPDINKEREFTFQSLVDGNVIIDSKKISFVPAYVAKNVFGDDFYSDGGVYIVEF